MTRGVRGTEVPCWVAPLAARYERNSAESMKTTKKIATITLVILLTAIAYGLFRTLTSTTASQLGPRESAVDQTALQTAQRFARMPNSVDELPFAQEALRLGDREMDLAFAAGVRQVQDHPVTLTAQAK